MIHQETHQQAEAKLLTVITNSQFEVCGGAYTFEELPAGQLANPEALACVRDGDVWNQLIPVSRRSSATERFKMFSFHFKENLDASGFVGWLASHLKRTVGTGSHSLSLRPPTMPCSP